MTRFFLNRGLTARPDGSFETPIAKEITCPTCEGRSWHEVHEGRITCVSCQGTGKRRSMVIDPKNYGFCRLESIPTDMQATCPSWAATKQRAEFERRMR